MASAPNLNKLCQEGNLRKIREVVEKMSDEDLEDRLLQKKGTNGYTLLHEAVDGGHPEVLDYLLMRMRNPERVVNEKNGNGYTSLHMAASRGSVQCTKVLLKHEADISIHDQYGKIAKQTAELSSKGAIVKILRSEGTML